MRNGRKVRLVTLVTCGILSSASTASAEPSARGERHLAAWPLGLSSKEVSKVLLVREGAEVPARELLAMESPNAELRFRVASGQVRFENGSEAALGRAGSDGVIETPVIKAGPVNDESSIEIVSRGRTLGVLRVRTLPHETWASILDVLANDPGVVVERAPAYAVVDLSMVKSSGLGLQQGFGSGAGQETKANRGGGVEPMALCVRVPWGPGWVNWGMSNPAGAGYSVKPESSGSLVWARSSGQDADGIYNRAWGCGTAFKIPDNCTATVASNGSISCCCNAAMAALGHVCRWLNPGAVGWPNCPL